MKINTYSASDLKARKLLSKSGVVSKSKRKEYFSLEDALKDANEVLAKYGFSNAYKRGPMVLGDNDLKADLNPGIVMDYETWRAFEDELSMNFMAVFPVDSHGDRIEFYGYVRRNDKISLDKALNECVSVFFSVHIMKAESPAPSPMSPVGPVYEIAPKGFVGGGWQVWLTDQGEPWDDGDGVPTFYTRAEAKKYKDYILLIDAENEYDFEEDYLSPSQLKIVNVTTPPDTKESPSV